jgi:hypothetical protein
VRWTVLPGQIPLDIHGILSSGRKTSCLAETVPAWTDLVGESTLTDYYQHDTKLGVKN